MYGVGCRLRPQIHEADQNGLAFARDRWSEGTEVMLNAIAAILQI
jgi:hypothetical protein